MAFNGTEGSVISLEEGAALTKAFRAAYPEQKKGFFIGRDIIIKVLSQEGAMGIRMYNGLDDGNELEPVFVAADANENDMLGFVIDNSVPCPTRCGTANMLNGD